MTKNEREARLAAQLRANLRRRKAQARGRAAEADPARVPAPGDDHDPAAEQPGTDGKEA